MNAKDDDFDDFDADNIDQFIEDQKQKEMDLAKAKGNDDEEEMKFDDGKS